MADYLRRELAELVEGRARDRLLARIRVVPMGLHVARYAVERPRLSAGRPVILAAGRLVPQKGFDRLLRAAVGLDAALLVAGDGPERGRLKRLAADLGVEARFLGSVPTTQMPARFAEADVFAFASTRLHGREEGAPRVLLEAMASGLAIAATATGGVGELLRHEATALVDDGEGEGLAANLRRLVADAALRQRLGEAALRAALRYDWTEIAPLMLRPFTESA
ncbi:MAG: glycosyltransferase [Myxococcales bacterium]|nr:MAG: glycosyltransferase [Myxococcales bacterium]